MQQVETKEREQGFKAVDVVILPPEEISNLAISLSEKLNDSPIVLNNKDLLPHITLAMGYIVDQEEVEKILAKIAASTQLFDVVIEKIERTTQPYEGYYFSHLVIKNERPIQQLHERLVDSLPFVTPTTFSQKAFVVEEDEEIIRSTLEYTARFKSASSHEKYWPHTTVGAGTNDLSVTNLPLTFRVDQITLCQMGNFNTCCKVLGQWRLKS